jgi:molybdopterin converting factor small subunit
MAFDGDASVEVEVRLTGQLRSLAGHGSIVLALPLGSTLRDTLAALEGVVPPSFMEQVVEPLASGASSLPILLLNRAHVSGAGALDRTVSQGDVVAFVTPMNGG